MPGIPGVLLPGHFDEGMKDHITISSGHHTIPSMTINHISSIIISIAIFVERFRKCNSNLKPG